MNVPDPEISKKTRKLWIVCAISNPARYNTRIKLYKAFRYHILYELGANLVTVECAYGERGYHAVENSEQKITYGRTDAGNEYVDVRVRNSSWIWLKENLWNIGASHVPNDCEYLCFSDADITFVNSNILTEIVESLQTWKVVQPFRSAIDLGAEGETIGAHQSFGYCYSQGYEWRPEKKTAFKKSGDRYVYISGPPVPGFGNPWHPGFAFAMRKTTFEKLGGLLEVGSLGAADHHMAASFIGRAELSMPGKISVEYKRKVLEWQERALRVVGKMFGYVPGTILHGYHGSKLNRKYIERWDILTQHGFTPKRCVQRNGHGVHELHKDIHPDLRKDIIRYFVQRKEDHFND